MSVGRMLPQKKSQCSRLSSMLLHLIVVLFVTGSMAEIGASGVHAETVKCAPDTAYGFAKLAVTHSAITFRTLLHRNVPRGADLLVFMVRANPKPIVTIPRGTVDEERSRATQ